MTEPVHVPPGEERATRDAIDPMQRRTLRVLGFAQAMSGFGLAAGITVGALLAAELWGSTALGGVPAVMMTLGSAGSALLIARIANRHGRRASLSAGYIAGALGALGIVVGASADVPALLIASFVVYGGGSAANLQARFAGADLAPPQRKATAVSTVLVATTLGAVLGPMLASATGGLARAIGLNPLVGPFLMAGAAYLVGGLVLSAALRPDPLLEARRRLAAEPNPAASTEASGVTPRREHPRWRLVTGLGIGVMVAGQAVMVAIMTMTPVYMRHHGHGVGPVGIVIGLHVAAMYLPSVVAGRIIDARTPRFGTLLAAAGLALAGATAALAPGDSVPWLAVALILLGVGWSLAIVSGSTLVARAVPAHLTATIQGRSDAILALGGAGAAGASGALMHAAGYGGLAWAGTAVALALVPVAVLVTRRAEGRAPTHAGD